ncbi:histidine-type phosphatase [Filimonas lacunae]|nr:histidine-type phosphatase [Filimonas lacunae]BAV06513.1 hypothetical protein FLA_2532 [Filimonas lacunae]
MKRSVFLVILFLFTQQAFSQQAPYTGTKTPYPVPKTATSAAPAGYQPVWINYVGRHGARFLTKAGSDVKLLKVLSEAEQKQGLTTTGKLIKQMVQRFLTIEKNNYEFISLLGKQEQAGIGARLLQQYPTVFKGGGKGLSVEVTHKIRTRQSAEAFVSQLGGYTGNIHFEQVQDSNENVLRFYDLSPAYLKFKKSDAVSRPIDSLNKDVQTQTVALHVAKKLFTSSWLKASTDKGEAYNWNTIAEYLYDLYSVQFSIPLEMKVKGYTKDSIDFGIAFSTADLVWLEFKNSAEDFLEKGAGTDTLGIQSRVAAPLLVDFINTTNEALHAPAGTASEAILRFTHAEAISPFATLLGIPQASVPSPAIRAYNQHWQASAIIPLSANIQWILYSNGNDFLVKVLLNEKEVALPIATTQYPYYKWTDVKQYYLKKLESLHVSPGDDMHRYLLELQ